MKRILIMFISLIFLLSACAPAGQPTEGPLVPNEDSTPTRIPVDLSPAQRAAITALSERSGLSADKIKVISTEAVTWRDGCLGVVRTGVMCTQAEVPGFKIVLEADGKLYEFHTNQNGSVVVLAEGVQTAGRMEAAVIKQLAANLGLKESDISVISDMEDEFGDACLGVAMEGVTCAEVMTPGRIIVLEANGVQYEYHTNADGSRVQPATLLMIWKREGGIAGFCDYMTVFLSSEVYGSTCKQDEYVEGRLIDVLSKEEIAKLDEWVKNYGNISIDASNPKGVSDRMVVALTFIGTGSQQTLSASKEQELMNFAQELHQRLYFNIK